MSRYKGEASRLLLLVRIFMFFTGIFFLFFFCGSLSTFLASGVTFIICTQGTPLHIHRKKEVQCFIYDDTSDTPTLSELPPLQRFLLEDYIQRSITDRALSIDALAFSQSTESPEGWPLLFFLCSLQPLCQPFSQSPRSPILQTNREGALSPRSLGAQKIMIIDLSRDLSLPFIKPAELFCAYPVLALACSSERLLACSFSHHGTAFSDLTTVQKNFHGHWSPRQPVERRLDHLSFISGTEYLLRRPACFSSPSLTSLSSTNASNSLSASLNESIESIDLYNYKRFVLESFSPDIFYHAVSWVLIEEKPFLLIAAKELRLYPFPLDAQLFYSFPIRPALQGQLSLEPGRITLLASAGQTIACLTELGIVLFYHFSSLHEQENTQETFDADEAQSCPPSSAQETPDTFIIAESFTATEKGEAPRSKKYGCNLLSFIDRSIFYPAGQTIEKLFLSRSGKTAFILTDQERLFFIEVRTGKIIRTLICIDKIAVS